MLLYSYQWWPVFFFLLRKKGEKNIWWRSSAFLNGPIREWAWYICIYNIYTTRIYVWKMFDGRCRYYSHRSPHQNLNTVSYVRRQRYPTSRPTPLRKPSTPHPHTHTHTLPKPTSQISTPHTPIRTTTNKQPPTQLLIRTWSWGSCTPLRKWRGRRGS